MDSTKEYEYSVWYFFPTEAVGALFIKIYDSTGQSKGWVGGGPTAEPTPNVWHKKTLSFNPANYASTFPDIAEVKLDLRLSLNDGLPEGTTRTIYYDEVFFGVK